MPGRSRLPARAQPTSRQLDGATVREELSVFRPRTGYPIYDRIPLAKSPEHNPCGKGCSDHRAKLDENRTSTLTNSTTMQSIGCVCRLVVISPTVSDSY